MRCAFTSDLHGKKEKYKALFEYVEKQNIQALLIGGDILPFAIDKTVSVDDYLDDFLLPLIKNSPDELEIYIIMGNDDPKKYEKTLKEWDEEGLLHYVNEKTEELDSLFVTGYSYVPPTPFRLKDWERYDISRFVDVGSVSPEEGIRTVEVPEHEIKYSTIKEELKELSNNSAPSKTIYLFHTPPYETDLDRADLDGKKVDHAPMDVHVGSIAVKRFIEEEQPLITLHGHVHETVELTGGWKEKIGETYCFTGVHHGSELPIVLFDPENPDEADRKLIDI